MKVQLLVSEWCEPCDRAEAIWREVAEMREIELEVLDMAQPEGRAVAKRLGIRSIPALVIDDALKGLGVPTRSAALEYVAAAPPRARTTVLHVGLVMGTSSRAAVLAAVAYLLVGGGFFAWYGGLPQSEPPRLAAIHLFTLGFVTFMIYGLGEHLLPRFTGNPIRFGAAAWAQQGLAHAGLLAFVLGTLTETRILLSAGATLAWLALLVFTTRILPVLWPAPASRPATGDGAEAASPGPASQ
ncbi:glutaredoxin family protein [Microbaculum sp. FT89]|uniref:glutaredoxin family protein n=1 Tax=Microbaculum sp. FT89 TaxID=3447298 RepID=UPI003F5319D5